MCSSCVGQGHGDVGLIWTGSNCQYHGRQPLNVNLPHLISVEEEHCIWILGRKLFEYILLDVCLWYIFNDTRLCGEPLNVYHMQCIVLYMQ